jgi:hypothetical protein
MRTYWESGSMHACTFNLSTRWRWDVSFTCQLFYPWGKKPWYPLDRRLDEPQTWSGCSDEEEKIPLPAGYQTLVIQPIAQSLYWLSYHGSWSNYGALQVLSLLFSVSPSCSSLVFMEATIYLSLRRCAIGISVSASTQAPRPSIPILKPDALKQPSLLVQEVLITPGYHQCCHLFQQILPNHSELAFLHAKWTLSLSVEVFRNSGACNSLQAQIMNALIHGLHQYNNILWQKQCSDLAVYFKKSVEGWTEQWSNRNSNLSSSFLRANDISVMVQTNFQAVRQKYDTSSR